jgi:hypothetical protein
VTPLSFLIALRGTTKVRSKSEVVVVHYAYEESDRYIEYSNLLESEFVEREATREPAIRLVSNSIYGIIAVGYHISHRKPGCRTVSLYHSQHSEGQSIQPTEGYDPDYVEVAETIFRVNDHRYRLFVVVVSNRTACCTYRSAPPGPPL